MKSIKLLVTLCLLLLIVTSAQAEKLGEAKTSGILIKDKVEVHVLDDPDIPGIACYYTLPIRALSLSNPTDSSISCRQVGPIDPRTLTSRKRIFKKSKNWLFKSLYIDRIYDAKRNVLVYVSYTKKGSGDNASNSISVVPVR